MDDSDPTTEELKLRQAEEEASQREAVHSAETSGEERARLRRADKAEYLRQKLEQREESERRAAQDENG